MLVTYIRSSSYNQYAYCQMSYFMTYVLGHLSDSGKKAELGTMVHKVMESLASFKKYQQDNPKKKYLEIKDEVLGSLKISKDELLTDSYVDTLCEMSYNAYKAQSKHDWIPSDLKQVKNLTLDALRYNGGQFDPRNRNVVNPEPHFDIAIEEDWAKFDYEINGEKVKGQLAIKGTIDLVTKVNDDTLEVVDWKTGRRLDWATGEEKDFKKLNDDPQLLLYNYAISKLYPEYKHVIMSIFFIKDGGPFSLCFDTTDHTKFLEMLKLRYKDIQNNQSPKPINEKRTGFKCEKLCHFYKNNWPNTDKKMCIFIGEHIKEHGIENTIKECTKPGFSLGYYESPG